MLTNVFWPTVLCKVAPLAQHVVCRLSSVCLSVTFCIVAKRHILAKNCLKEQIGLPPETAPRYQFGLPIYPLRHLSPYGIEAGRFYAVRAIADNADHA